MKTTRKAQHILAYESLGFAAIILLSWVDEVFSLPYRLFGGVGHSNWRESMLETAVVLVVWAGVYGLTQRLLKRLHYLEGFLRVCAWCRKIGHEDEWLPLEQYFDRHLDTKTTHAICPGCARSVMTQETPGAVSDTVSPGA